ADPIRGSLQARSKRGQGALSRLGNPVRLRDRLTAGGEETLRGGRFQVQDRGLAAYIAELVGTLLLVFFITSVIVLYVATGQNAVLGSDFAVVGLTHFLVLFALIISVGVASGGHFNPAITAAFIALRRIDPVDGLVYILAQLSGGVLGALLTKAFLLDEGPASDYRTPKIRP